MVELLGVDVKGNDHFHSDSTSRREHRKIKALKMLARWESTSAGTLACDRTPQ